MTQPVSSWTGQRVTLWGLGTHGGGVAAARHLVAGGARLTITDRADAQTLAGSLGQIADLPIEEYVLGGHDDRLALDADVVVVNPAVPRDDGLLARAADAGVTLTSEIELFLNACPGRVIGVTGANGKSSTCTMLAAALRSTGRQVWLGGNIGHSLLADVSSMGADDLVVVELSSFQLAWLNKSARWPEMAIVTNLSPNHLDWHRSFANYAIAKRRLIEHLPPGGCFAFDATEPTLQNWPDCTHAKPLTAWADARVPPLQVAGAMQRKNAALAAAVAEACGASELEIVASLMEFRGLPHRVELIAEVDGRQFFDDSKSTTPESTIAALESMTRSTWLIVGGRNKGLDFVPLAPSIARKCRGVIAFGESGDELCRSLQKNTPAVEWNVVETLAEAVDWCWQRADPGEAILLSPACASFDQYTDYRARGAAFAKHVARVVRAAPMTRPD